jgi:hypothetical protein
MMEPGSPINRRYCGFDRHDEFWKEPPEVPFAHEPLDTTAGPSAGAAVRPWLPRKAKLNLETNPGRYVHGTSTYCPAARLTVSTTRKYQQFNLNVRMVMAPMNEPSELSRKFLVLNTMSERSKPEGDLKI